MQINFYSEFPKEGLKKIDLIDYKCKIFFAADSLRKFKRIKNKVGEINKKIICCWWPIFKGSYWVSPFSDTDELKRIFSELDNTNEELLIDLELPFLNKKLFFKNLFKLRKNRALIREFLEENKERITTAQFPLITGKIFGRFLGLDYKTNTEKSIMCYSSIIPKFIDKAIKRQLANMKNKGEYSIGVGTIATGILSNENILVPEKMEKDLEFLKEIGVKKVIIFRLGGLNGDYIKIIKKYQNAKA